MTSNLAHPVPPGENALAWAGACALAARRHPNAPYPQPADLTDAWEVLNAILTVATK